MARGDDEIPDLLPGNPGGAGAPSPRGTLQGGPPRRAPAPPVAAKPAASPLASPEEDEFEFDVLGVTSRRSEELLHEFLGGPTPAKSAGRGGSVGLSLDYSAAARPVKSGRASSPELELGSDFDGAAATRPLELTEEAEEVVSRRSSYPPDARRLGSDPPVRRSSAPPPSPAVPRSSRSVPPVARPSSIPGPRGAMEPGSPPEVRVASSSLGGVGELDLFDFDAAMGIAPAKDFAVAVALPGPDDVGYPTGETPRPDDFAFDASFVEARSGFGPRPKSALGAPLYALRVSVGRKQLLREFDDLRRTLAAAEDARDRALADLAESHRDALSTETRFVALFADVRRFEELETERERALAATSSAGASDLSALEGRLDAARSARLEADARRDEHIRVVTEAGRVVQRAQSQRKRLEIEMRNIERLALERVPEGAAMPADLALRYVPVQREHELAVEALRRAEEQERGLRAALRSLEEASRRALGDEQRVVAEREGFLLTHSGDVGESAKLLEEARLGRVRELARAARGILALRGEVPVSEQIRKALFAHEDSVARAARELALVERALASADARAIARGKSFALACAALLLVALLGLAMR